jgi:Skp family chaperone for outer membrane proteins
LTDHAQIRKLNNDLEKSKEEAKIKEQLLNKQKMETKDTENKLNNMERATDKLQKERASPDPTAEAERDRLKSELEKGKEAVNDFIKTLEAENQRLGRQLKVLDSPKDQEMNKPAIEALQSEVCDGVLPCNSITLIDF